MLTERSKPEPELQPRDEAALSPPPAVQQARHPPPRPIQDPYPIHAQAQVPRRRPEPTSQRVEYHEISSDSDEYGFEADDSFIRQLDEVEAKATVVGRGGNGAEGAGSRRRLGNTGGVGARREGASVEVIEISD
jgi:hypothetical protein